jgi:hypothetical protein
MTREEYNCKDVLQIVVHDIYEKSFLRFCIPH